MISKGYETTTLLALVTEVCAGHLDSPLSEADLLVIDRLGSAMEHYGAKGIGCTFMVSVGDDCVYVLEEPAFQSWLARTDLIEPDRVSPLKPQEMRVVILFESGVFCAPIINNAVLN